MVQFKTIGALFCFLCLLLPLTSAKSSDVHYCNKKTDYAVKVSGIDISPFPISRGVKTTFAIAASTIRLTDEAISDGTLKIDVAYFGFYIHSESHNICEETSCPISNGDFVISHSQELPGITPPGPYTLKMTLIDGKKKQLTCITFDFSIGFIAPESLAEI